jgi:hypothetical protein
VRHVVAYYWLSLLFVRHPIAGAMVLVAGLLFSVLLRVRDRHP